MITKVEERHKSDECRTDRRHKIEVKINNRPVHFRRRRVTGLEIKEAAIEQGVPIQTDFVLYLLVEDNRRQVIGDCDKVKLTPGACFEAIPNDDNS